MKKVMFGIVIVLGALFLILITLFIAAVTIPMSAPDIAEPSLQYAEFPFWIEYTDNGKYKRIDSTAVIRYEGMRWTFDLGWRREWSLSYSEEEKILLKQQSDGTEIYLDLPIFYFISSNDGSLKYAPKPHADVYNANTKKHNAVSDEVLQHEYGICFTEWEFADSLPIIDLDDHIDYRRS